MWYVVAAESFPGSGGGDSAGGPVVTTAAWRRAEVKPPTARLDYPVDVLYGPLKPFTNLLHSNLLHPMAPQWSERTEGARGLHLPATPMGGCCPWLTGRAGWKKSLEPGYGYGHGYQIFFDI